MTKFIAIGPNCWGADPKNPRQAITNARKNCSMPADQGRHCFDVYAVTDETYVNDMGGFNHPGADPALISLYGHYDYNGRAPKC